MQEITIDELGAQGDGVGRSNGQPVFVPFTLPGDVVTVQPEKGGKGGRVQRARLQSLVTPGPGRIAPSCRHFGKCGGCALQHVDDDHLLNWKRQRVVSALSRQGLGDVEVLPTLAGAAGRRRRVVWTVAADRRGDIVFGFAARRHREVVSVRECPVIDPDLQTLIAPLKKLMAGLAEPGTRGRVTATATLTGIDLLLETSIRDTAEGWQDLAEFAEQHDLARLSVKSGPDQDPMTVAERRAPILKFGDTEIVPPIGGFLQADPEMENAMRDAVRAAAVGAGRILDLFSGCGTLGLSAPVQVPLHAVEGDARALAALKRAADRNVRPVSVEKRDLFKRPLAGKDLEPYDLVIIDPPRSGARDQAEQLAASRVPKVLWVSCDPDTFARDARAMVDGGYRMGAVTPMDQFHWSPEIELHCLFTRDAD